MSRIGDQEVAGRLGSMASRFEKERLAEKAADSDAADAAILAAINRAISLQEGDNDTPGDAKVMSLLKQAKVAQEQDIKEDAD